MLTRGECALLWFGVLAAVDAAARSLPASLHIHPLLLEDLRNRVVMPAPTYRHFNHNPTYSTKPGNASPHPTPALSRCFCIGGVRVEAAVFAKQCMILIFTSRAYRDLLAPLGGSLSGSLSRLFARFLAPARPQK